MKLWGVFKPLLQQMEKGQDWGRLFCQQRIPTLLLEWKNVWFLCFTANFPYVWAHLQDHVLRGQKGDYLGISFCLKYPIISLAQDGRAPVHMQHRTFITSAHFLENSCLFKYQDGVLANTQSAGWGEKFKPNSLPESKLNERYLVALTAYWKCLRVQIATWQIYQPV